MQRLVKLCHDCSKLSEVNQMTAKNLAIVFSPIIFADTAEDIGTLARTQGPKMTALEVLILNYDTAFPVPYESTYKPPARPGEVPLMTGRDWHLMLAKAETQTFKAGDIIAEVGKPLERLNRICAGSGESSLAHAVLFVSLSSQSIPFPSQYFLLGPKGDPYCGRYLWRTKSPWA